MKNDDFPLKVGGGGDGNFLNFNILLLQFLVTTAPNLKINIYVYILKFIKINQY